MIIFYFCVFLFNKSKLVIYSETAEKNKRLIAQEKHTICLFHLSSTGKIFEADIRNRMWQGLLVSRGNLTLAFSVLNLKAYITIS